MSRLTLAWSVEFGRRQFEIGRAHRNLLGLFGEPLADRLQIGIARHVDDAQDVLRARLGQTIGRDPADLRALLTDEAEGAVGLPLVLSRLVDINGDARRDRLLDVGIDHAGDEIADNDRVGVLRDRRLHGPRRSRLDVGFVDWNVVQLHPQRLGRVLGPLVQGRKK